MLKCAILFFLVISAIAGRSQNYSSADTTAFISADTLLTTFYLTDAVAGDTVYFGMGDLRTGELIQYFSKNLRAPQFGDSVVKGMAKVYFIIDKSGRVTQAWYDKDSNIDIGQETIRVVNKLPKVRPTSIKGEAVITRVLLKVLVLGKGEINVL